MKTIGIIGGMSPESTVLYYQIINRETNRRLGGNRSAKILLDSVDFEEIVRLQKSGDWAAAGNVLAQSARKLEAGGADFLLLATNTMHKVAPAIEQAAGIPLLHVVDATAAAIKRQGLSAVGLLGTRFTMSDGFYTERMGSQGVKTIAPTAAEQDEIHRIIFDELCLNRIRPLLLRRDRPSEKRRRAGRDTRLHRNLPACERNRQPAARVRQHCHPCALGSGCGAGGISGTPD